VDPRRLPSGLAKTYDGGEERAWDKYDQDKATEQRQQVRQSAHEAVVAKANAKEQARVDKLNFDAVQDMKAVEMDAAGLGYHKNPDGTVVEAKDPMTGKPVVKDIDGPTKWDSTGRAYKVERKAGEMKQSFLDAEAPIGGNPKDPNDKYIYRQNANAKWDAIDPEEGVLSPDAKVREASTAALRTRKKTGLASEQAKLRAELTAPDMNAPNPTQLEDARVRKSGGTATPADELLITRQAERDSREKRISEIGVEEAGLATQSSDTFNKASLAGKTPEEQNAVRSRYLAESLQKMDARKAELKIEDEALNAEALALKAVGEAGYTAAEAPDIIRQRESLLLRSQGLKAKFDALGTTIDDHNRYAGGLRDEQVKAVDAVKEEQAAKAAANDSATGVAAADPAAPKVALDYAFTPKFRAGTLEAKNVADLQTAIAQNPGKDVFLRPDWQTMVEARAEGEGNTRRLLGNEEAGGKPVADVRQEREAGYAAVAEITNRGRELQGLIKGAMAAHQTDIASAGSARNLSPEEMSAMFEKRSAETAVVYDKAAERMQGDLRRVRDLAWQGAVPMNKVVDAYKAAGIEVKPVPDMAVTLDAAGKLSQQDASSAAARMTALKGYIKEYGNQPLFNTGAVDKELTATTKNLKSEQLRATGGLNVAKSEIADGWDQYTGTWLMMRAAMNHLAGDDEEFLSLHAQSAEHMKRAEERGSVVDTFGEIESLSDTLHYVGKTVSNMVFDLGETVVTTVAGAAIGSAVAPGPGTVGGGVAGLMGKTAVKKLIAKEAADLMVKRKLTSEMATVLVESRVLMLLKSEIKGGGKGPLFDIMRKQSAANVAKWGAFGSSFRGNGGEYLQSTLGSMTPAQLVNDPDKVDRSIAASLILGAPAAALDALTGMESGLISKLVGRPAKELRAVADKGMRSFMKEVGMGALKAAKNPATEGATGFMQGILGVYAARISNQTDLSAGYTAAEQTEIWENAIGELIGGGAFGGAGGAARMTAKAMRPLKEAWQLNQAGNALKAEIAKSEAVMTATEEGLAEMAGVDPQKMATALGPVPALEQFGTVPGITAQIEALGLVAEEARNKGDRVTAREALRGMAQLEKDRREAVLTGVQNLVGLEEQLAGPVMDPVTGLTMAVGTPEHVLAVATARAVVAVATGRAATLDNGQLATLGLARGPAAEIVVGEDPNPSPDGVPRVTMEAGQLILGQGLIDRTKRVFPAAAALITAGEVQRRDAVLQQAAQDAAQAAMAAQAPTAAPDPTAAPAPAAATTAAPTAAPTAPKQGRQWDVEIDGVDAPVRVTAESRTAAIAQVAATGQGMVRDAVEVPVAAPQTAPDAPTAEPAKGGSFADAITAAGEARGLKATPERVARNKEMAKALEMEAKKWAGAFPGGFRVKENTLGGGLQIDSTDRALELDFGALAKTAENTKQNTKEWARLAVIEEVIHSAALELEKGGKLDAAGLYNSLPAKVQRVVRDAYNRSSKEPRNLGHEFLRMIVQGRMAISQEGWKLDGKLVTTEQAGTDLKASLRRAVNALLGYLRNLQKQLAKAGAAPETIAQIEDTVKLIEGRMREFLGGVAQNQSTTNEQNQTPSSDGKQSAGPSVPESRDVPMVPAQTEAQGETAGATTITQHGVKLKAVFALREQSTLLPSHDFRGQPSTGYDQALQPRDRSLPEYQKQSQNIARELDFDQAAFFPDTNVPATTPDLGAPVVDANGQVIVGNGRFNGVAMAYSEGFPTAAKYKAALAKNAARFGLTPEDVMAMKEPVLVRVLEPTDRETVIKFSQGSNEGVAMRTNATELAGQDAQRLAGPARQVLTLLDPNFDLEAKQNEAFRTAYVAQVIDAGGTNEANLTGPELASRMRMGIFASAYGLDAEGRAALARMAASTGVGAKKITAALLTMAAGMGWMKAEGKAGNLHPRDISVDLGAAAQRIAVALRDKSAKTPSSAVYQGLESQTDVFENPMVTELMQFLIANRTNQARMEEVISNYVEGVAQLGNPAQVDMFGGEPATREQLWQKAVDPATTETRENRHALATAALSSAVLPSQIGPDNLDAFAGVVDKRILATIKMLDVTLEFDAEWQLPKLPEPTGPKPPATAREVDGVFVLTHATAVIQPTMIKDDDGEVIPNYLLDYLEPGKEYTRDELHEAIIDLYLDRAEKARANGRGKVLFTGGGPAAGKSTFIREMQSTGEIATGDGILTLTADDIKMLIPEMQEMLARGDSRAAGTVHVESQKIFNDVVVAVLALPYHVNLIWDATLSHAPQVIPLMEQIKGLGYEMHLRGIVIDPWEAMNRSVDRGLKSKRLVPAGGTLWGHKGFHMNFREYLPLVDSYEVRGIMFGDNVYEDGGQGLRSIVVESSVSPVAKDRGEQYYFTQERSNLNEYATNKTQLLASYDYGHPALETNQAGDKGASESTQGNEDQGNVPDNGRRSALRPAAPAGPLSSADLFGEWADSLPAKTKRSKPAFAKALKAEVPAGKLPTVAAISDLFDFASSGGYGVNYGTQGNGSGSDGRPGNTGAAVGTPAGGKNSKRSKNAPGGANDLFDWSAEFQTGGTTAGSGQPGGNGPDGRGTGSGGNSDGVAKPPERGAAEKPVGGLREDPSGRDGLHPIVPQPENPADRNHVIDPMGKVAPRTNSQKWAGNFEAMKLLRQLDADGRNPTPEEKSVLEAYTGWGWMKEAFNDVRAKAYAELKSTWEATIAREIARPPYRESYDRSPARSTDWQQRARENDPEKAQTLLSWQATYGQHYDRLRAELTDKEFRSAAKSVRNAHFTTPSVIGSMWKAVARLGFKGGRAMEPGGGIGHFIGVQPPSMAERTRWEATELDDVTARILSKLYPQARVNGMMPAPGREVSGMGFQDSRIPNNSLDLLISNVPFAKEGPGKAKSEFGQDFNLHNYFFARALAKVKPGGLVVFITSSGTMESQRAQRAYLNGKAELVASWRLPNDAFAENAGTEVVTDVIMLRKPDGKQVMAPEPWMEKMQVGRDNVMSRRPVDKTRPWQKTTVDLHTWFSDIEPDWNPTSVEMATAWRPWMDGGRPKTGKKWDAVVKAFRERPDSSDSLEFSAPIRVNEYYARHPENVLGRHALQGSMYSAGEYTVQSMGSLDEQLAAAVERLPENILGDAATTGWDAVAAERDDKIDSYVERDGIVYQVTAEGLEPVEWNENETLDKAKRTAAKKKMAIFRQWAKLRDAAVEMVNLEVNPASMDTDLDAARARLNTAYNGVLAYFGPLGVRRNNKYRFLEDDPQYALLEALEEESMVTNERGEVAYRYKKADIFRQRIIPVLEAPTTAASLEEAVSVSMAWQGSVNPRYVADLTGTSEPEARMALLEGGHVYEDTSSGQLMTADEYLSGPVAVRLREAEAAAKDNPDYARNVEALRNALPPRRMISEASINVGARWIPDAVYTAYMAHLGVKNGAVKYVKERNHFESAGRGGLPEWETGDWSAFDTLDAILNNRKLLVTSYNRVLRQSVVDSELTAQLESKALEMADDFRQWVRTTDTELADPENDGVMVPIPALTENIFNEKVNGITPPKFVGDWVTLPGQSGVIWLKPFRKAVIARLLTQGRGMMAHGVGSGKTFNQIALAMELRRLGKARKPVIVVQNSTINQFAKSFRQAYPQAKLLVATPRSYSAKARARFTARMATGDWDAIIMTHSNLEQIPNSQASVDAYFARESDELDAAISAADDTESQSRLQAARDKLLEKRTKMIARLGARQDNVLDWEQIGVDALIVDEAHAFKNAPVVTNRGRDVKNIPSTGEGSDKAVSMMLKTHNVRERMKGKGVFFATGTPISNTMAEAYVMLRYIAPDMLEANGIVNFDDFAAQYGTVVSQTESTWDGSIKVVDRFTKFVNGPQFIRLIRSVFDVAMGNESLGLDVPSIAGGKAEQVVVPVTQANQAFNEWIVNEVAPRWKAIGRKEIDEDPRLTAIPIMSLQAGMAAALDPRLIHDNAPDYPGSKVNVAIKRALEIYRSGDANKTAQVMFSDLFNSFRLGVLGEFAGNPFADMGRNEGAFNLGDDIKAKLIAGGMKPEEVVVVTTEKDEKLTAILDAVNEGKVRVIIGSTARLGVGVNIQERLAMVHHLMPPRDFKPAMMEQRNGRIIRQGNLHAEWRDAAFARVVGTAAGTPFAGTTGAKRAKAAKEWLTENDKDGAIRTEADAAAKIFDIGIIEYAVQRSTDSVVYSMMAAKQGMVAQSLSGESIGNEFDDPTDEIQMGFNEMAAQAMGDPLMIRQVMLDRDLRQLRNSYNGWQRQGASRAADIRRIAASITYSEGLLNRVDREAATYGKLFLEADGKPVYKFDGKTIDTGAKDGKIINPLDLWLAGAAGSMAMQGDKQTTLAMEVNGRPFEVTAKLKDNALVGVVQVPGSTEYKDWYAGGQSLVLGIRSLVSGIEDRPANSRENIAFLTDRLAELRKVDAGSQEFPQIDKLRALETEYALLRITMATRNETPTGAATEATGPEMGTLADGMGRGGMLAPLSAAALDAIGGDSLASGVSAGNHLGVNQGLAEQDADRLAIFEQNIDEILKLATGAKTRVLGLRVMVEHNNPVPQVKPGDALAPSSVWNDGEPTKRKLAGTSTIGIKLDRDSIREALFHLGVTGGRDLPGFRYGYYYGAQVVLVTGTSSRIGSDFGERVIRDARVLGAWNKSEGEARSSYLTTPVYLAPLSAAALQSASFDDALRGAGVDLDELDSLMDRADNESSGSRKTGNPDLSLGAGTNSYTTFGDPVIMGVDEYRNATVQEETFDQWRADAVEMLRANYDGTVRRLVDIGLSGGQLTPELTQAAQIIVEQESRMPMNPARKRTLQALVYAYRQAGTEQARGLAARRDPFKTPEERHREFLAKQIFTPPAETRKKLEAAGSAAERQRILGADAQRIARIEAEFAKMGVTLDDLFSGGIQLSLAKAKIIGETAAGLASDKHRRAAVLLKGGTQSALDIGKAVGLTPQEVLAVKDHMDRQLTKAMEARLARAIAAASSSLQVAAMAGDEFMDVDFARMVGMTEAERAAEIQKLVQQMGYGIPVKQLGKRKIVKRKRLYQPPTAQSGMSGEEYLSQPMGRDGRGTQPRLGQMGTPDNSIAPGPGKVWDRPALAQNELDLGLQDEVSILIGADLADAEDVVRLARVTQAAHGGAMDMLQEYWINNILSGPQTQVVNIVGNSAFAGVELTVQRGMEALWNLVIQDDKSASFGEFGAMRQALLPGLVRGMRLFSKSWRTETDWFAHEALNAQLDLFETGPKGEGRATAISGTKGKVIRIPGRALMATDGFFKGLIGQMEAAAQAYRIAKAEGLSGDAMTKRMNQLLYTPGSQAWQLAVQKAQELTFQEDLPENLKPLQKWKNSNRLLGFVVPFIRTPYNIFRHGIRKSPLGAANLIWQLGKHGMVKLSGGRLELATAASPQMIKWLAEQTLAMAALALLKGAAEGDDDDEKKWLLITGSQPADFAERDLQERTAGGAYVIRIGGVRIPYGRVEPFATVLGSTVDALRISKGGGDVADKFGRVLGSLQQAAMDKTFLSGLAALFDTMKQPGKLADKGQRAVMTALVPNLIRQPLRNMDSMVRDGSTADWYYQLAPFGAGAESRVNTATGVDKEKTGNALTRILLPALVKQDGVEPSDIVLRQWNAANPGKEAWAPGTPDRTHELQVDGKTVRVKLNAGAYKQLSGRSAALARQSLQGLNLKPTQDDVDRIKKAYTDGRRRAWGELKGQPVSRLGDVED
jgi:N12 class adenine-specific DNA methylase